MKSSIPPTVLKEFYKFLDKEVIEHKFFYRYDEDGNKKLDREVIDKMPRDLKATLSLFEKIYPKYFDPLTMARIEKLSSKDDTDTLKKDIRDMFSIDDDS